MKTKKAHVKKSRKKEVTESRYKKVTKKEMKEVKGGGFVVRYNGITNCGVVSC